MQIKELTELFRKGLINEAKYKEEIFIASLEKKKRHPPRRQYEGLNEDEFKKLYDSYLIDKQKVILLLAYGAGLRLQEILNLQKDNFDFDNKIIKVRQGKFSKDRITLLPKDFNKSYLEYIPFKYTKPAVQKMFNTRSIEVGINQKIATYKLKSGKERILYKYHFHCLRHSFAVNLLRKGVPLNHIQKLLGHSNIAATSTYTNIGAFDAVKFALEKGF